MVRRGKKGGKRHARSQEDEYCPSLSDFKTKKLLGKGGCGAVFLVRKVKGPGCGNLFAMKKIHTSSVRTAEREVLHAMSGQPFFPALHWSFLTEDSQCLVMDYVKGVEILEMMAKQRLTLAKVKFYAAELLSAVDHLHKHGIVHRDIKNDNVMVDEEGHVCLIDFGLAKRLATEQENFSQTCSQFRTKQHMAPETQYPHGHGFAADLWSLGVLLFEMWAGEFPFPEDADREVTRRRMEKGEVTFPSGTPGSLISLLTGLLRPDPKVRLTVQQAMEHEFFQGLDWMQVQQRGMTPPC